MTYAWFPGCRIPFHLPDYGRQSLAVLSALGAPAAEMEFNCCGYPVRHQSLFASVLSAARAMAVAARAGLDILTPCKCCFGHLRFAQSILAERPDLMGAVTDALRPEALRYDPDLTVSHLLPLLVREVGLPAVEKAVVRPLTWLRAAAHYGCHALRPSQVTRFDDPLAPVLFENLLSAAGCVPVSWTLRLECCGQPLAGKNDRLAMALAHSKYASALEAGADVLVTACTYCQMQLGSSALSCDLPAPGMGQAAGPRPQPPLPVATVSRILGAALGLWPLEERLEPPSGTAPVF
ncbi:cob--com heterodisulfide reductase subunit b [hydrocarbon metagenome]|uniref:Cob--com heterodisulfide reductase subunit b n=1 Tax=hydrocarbon metagenome TaxID=938273 RepID=A0A0W8G3F8_9ZZZZ